MSPCTLCGSATWATSNQLLFTRCLRPDGECWEQTLLLRARHQSGPVLRGKHKPRLGENEKKRNMEATADVDPCGGESKAMNAGWLCCAHSRPVPRPEEAHRALPSAVPSPGPILLFPRHPGHSTPSRAERCKGQRSLQPPGGHFPHLPQPVSSPAGEGDDTSFHSHHQPREWSHACRTDVSSLGFSLWRLTSLASL